MMFIRLLTGILVLSTLACVCKARIKTFNEVIKYGVGEETRKALQKCWLNHETVYRDVVASGRDLVFKCSGLSQQTVTYRQCDQKCNLPKNCLNTKHYVNKPERKVVKIVRLVDKKVFNVVLPFRCECKNVRSFSKNILVRKLKSRVVIKRIH